MERAGCECGHGWPQHEIPGGCMVTVENGFYCECPMEPAVG